MANQNQMKIKGGAWTVSKFFILSIGYTCVWLAVSSELRSLKDLYGPAVLLWLNIAYYAPSLPLLIFSSLTDRYLESRFGSARVCFSRLILGLAGYGLLCAWFPWAPTNPRSLILIVMGLGAFSGVTFAASYQLVSRFANKNVIALGLGCTASGPLVLLLQVFLGLHGKQPTRDEHIVFYSVVALFVAAGLWAGVSLLWRHWDKINSDQHQAQTNGDALQQPLLEDGQQHLHTTTATTSAAAVARGGSPRVLSRPGSANLLKHPSLPPLTAYGWLDPYETHIPDDWNDEIVGLSPRARRSKEPMEATTAGAAEEAVGAGSRRGAKTRHSWSAPLRTITSWKPQSRSALPDNSTATVDDGDSYQEGADAAAEREQEEDASLLDVVRLAWPVLVAIGIQSGVALTLFPFFTFIPSCGWLGGELATVLFWTRIFADILGRAMPRASAFCPTSPKPLLVVAALKLLAEPLFFVYIKCFPPAWRADVAAIVYVMLMWGASGWLNSAANMLAPKMVPLHLPHLKSAVAGLMALTYQAGHLIALGIAIGLAILLFGGIGVGE